MRPRGIGWLLVGLWCTPWSVGAYQNSSRTNVLRSGYNPLLDDRPDRCPPCPSCFNCNAASDVCHQFADCNKSNGKCSCPSGFGGDDCTVPLCGALPDGDQREPRPDDVQSCECNDGWGGINCNVCKTDNACRAMYPPSDGSAQEGAVCYKEALVVKENFQMCNVTNQKIIDQLKDDAPQVTFSCNAEREECSFQCTCRHFQYLGFADGMQFGLAKENHSTVLSIHAHGKLSTARTGTSRSIIAITSNARAFPIECFVAWRITLT